MTVASTIALFMAGVGLAFLWFIVDCLGHINRRLAELGRTLERMEEMRLRQWSQVIPPSRKESHPHG